MANCFSYKQTTSTIMKITGTLDSDSMIVFTEESPKRLKTLLSDFNGADVDIQIKIKSDRDLDEPVETE